MREEGFANFPRPFNTLVVENRVRSIFDQDCAGQLDTYGGYYCIHVDHKTHECYAVPKDISLEFREGGRSLEEGEVAEFYGERVRGMTMQEAIRWNADILNAVVDLWGNIAIEENLGGK